MAGNWSREQWLDLRMCAKRFLALGTPVAFGPAEDDATRELCDALDDMTKWVAAFARGKSAADHRVVISSPRYLKALDALRRARGDQPDSDPPIPNSATPQGA